MILDIIPYSTEKNLGKAYNEAMALAPDNSHVCLRDGDTCWLTPDYGVHLSEYVSRYPDAVLTCWTNRINAKAEQQWIGRVPRYDADKDISVDESARDSANMGYQINIANELLQDLYKVTPLHGFVSGFCMVIPKKVWEQTKFPEVQQYSDRGPTNMLGVDNWFTNEVRRKGVQILRMDGMYIWHTYRLLTGDNDKTHLL